MNAENALAWIVIGVIAMAALYLKGYIPLTFPWTKGIVAPLLQKAETVALSELEQLAAALAQKAKAVAEKDLTAAKAKEVTEALLAHFKAPASPTPPAGAPTEPVPPPAR